MDISDNKYGEIFLVREAKQVIYAFNIFLVAIIIYINHSSVHYVVSTSHIWDPLDVFFQFLSYFSNFEILENRSYSQL